MSVKAYYKFVDNVISTIVLKIIILITIIQFLFILSDKYVYVLYYWAVFIMFYSMIAGILLTLKQIIKLNHQSELNYGR